MTVSIWLLLLTSSLVLVASHSPVRSTYGPPPFRGCQNGYVRKLDGTCTRPIINKNIFLYKAPKPQFAYGAPPIIPDPEINYNYVFIKAPSTIVGPEPIVVPPPQQKTLVYVLSEQEQRAQQQLIEVPSEVYEPEVFFINYKEGENPLLPGGIDLKTALAQPTHAAFSTNEEQSLYRSTYA